MMSSTISTLKLPELVKASDCSYPKYPKNPARESQAAQTARRVVATFELWYVQRAGWVIPTLDIARAKFGPARRTYAIALNDKQVYTVGNGPHVLAMTTVYVTNARLAALQPLLDLKTAGMGDAGMIRDRISTRRARTSLRRQERGF